MDINEQIFISPGDIFVSDVEISYSVRHFEMIGANQARSDYFDLKDNGPRKSSVFYESLIYEVQPLNRDLSRPGSNTTSVDTRLAFTLNGKGFYPEAYQPKYETKLTVTD